MVRCVFSGIYFGLASLLGCTLFCDSVHAQTFVPVTTLGPEKVAWGDFNNDGFVDINTGGSIYRNNAGSSFTPVHATGTGVWGDYDNDGWLDVFSYDHGNLYYNNQGNGFSTVSMPGVPTASQGAAWGDHDNDGFLDIYVGGYRDGGTWYADVILDNNQGTSFSNTWTQPSNEVRPGRGITSSDFDRDGDIDVYVSNYLLERNQLHINDGSGNFSEQGIQYGVSSVNGHSIGSAWGDFDNDGQIDLFAGNFAHSGQPQSRFLRNLGPASGYTFQDRGQAGVAWQESYASPTVGDYDNDGDLDLFFTTVYSGDAPRLYRNDGNWNFTNVTGSVGLDGIGQTYQAGFADYNNDGALDLVSGGKLFRNQSNNGNHWIKLKLQGDGVNVNRDAVGAQVRISIGNETLTRQVEFGTGTGNQNDPTLHFGLGDHTGTVDLKVLWPGGNTQTVNDVSVNQSHLVMYESPPPTTDPETRTYQQGFDYYGTEDRYYDYNGAFGSGPSHGSIDFDAPEFDDPSGCYGHILFENVFGPGEEQVPVGPSTNITSATLKGWVKNGFDSASLYRLLDDISNRPQGGDPAVVGGDDRLDAPGVAGTFYDTNGSRTFDTQPSNTPDPPALIEWDVTDIVSAWAAGETNHGFLLLNDNGSGGEIVSSHHNDNQFRPLLTIDFNHFLVSETTFTWNLTGGGDWNTRTNWSAAAPSVAPNGNHDAIFGDKIAAGSTVFTDVDVSVRRIDFDHDQTYVVAGAGSINLITRADSEGEDLAPVINVLQGTHMFQAPVHFHDDGSVNVASESTLIFDGALHLTGNTIIKTGMGTMSIRNDFITGGGTLTITEGMVSGNGTLVGNLSNSGGIISPGNSGTATVGIQVPEPGSLLLLVLGGVVIGWAWRRRK